MSTAQPSSANTHRRPSVSAVIPAYNAADTIERALSSVYAQTYENIIEVIVVDDGSSDETADVVRSDYPDVMLIQQANAGPASSRNTGLARASGDYVAFLDADDEWLPAKVAEQVLVVSRHPGICVLLCQATVVDGAGREVAAGRSTSGTALVEQVCFRDLLEFDLPVHMSCSCFFCSRTQLVEVSGFEDGTFRTEDWELLLRTAGLGYTVALLDRVLYRYHIRETSLSNRRRAFEGSRQVEVLGRWDPEGTDWRGDLVSPSVYRTALSHLYWRRGWIQWKLGEEAEARASFRSVAAIGSPWTVRWLRACVAARVPRAYEFLAGTKCMETWPRRRGNAFLI